MIPLGPCEGGKGPEAAAAFEQDSLSPLRAGPLAVCAPKVLENSYSSLNPVSPCVCVCVCVCVRFQSVGVPSCEINTQTAQIPQCGWLGAGVPPSFIKSSPLTWWMWSGGEEALTGGRRHPVCLRFRCKGHVGMHVNRCIPHESWLNRTVSCFM